MLQPRLPVATVLLLTALTAPAVTQVTVTLGASKDTTLLQNQVLSNGAGSRFHCGNTAQAVNIATRRGLIAFDTSAIPSCARITSVQLTLFVEMTGGVANLLCSLHRVTADWGEGTSVASSGQGIGAPPTPGDATWTHRFHPGQTWSTPGGDFDPVPSVSTPSVFFGSYTLGSSAGLVADVQRWVDDPSSNFGWMIRSDETTLVTARAFLSRDSLYSQPSLAITYTTAAVTSSGVGCKGSGGSSFTATAVGLPTFPNPNFAIQLSGGPPVLVEAVVLTVRKLPFAFPFGGPGCNLFVDTGPFNFLLPGVAGLVAMPIPGLSASSECVTLSVQGLALDANTQLIVLTNALDLTFGK